jgi:VCBS repeat-containing protein
VLANDSDPDGDGLTVTAISAVGGASRTVSGLLAGTYGHLTLNAYGSYTYVADNAAAIAAAPTGSHPLDAFSYTISDGLGATSTATLDIVIDRSPIAANDLAGVQIGKSISGNVLANDRDLDGDSIRVVGLGGGSLGQSVAGKYGTLVLGPDGTYTYVSNKNAQMPSQGVAQDVFAYTESDGHGGTGQAMLSITTIPNGLNYIAGTPGAAITSGNGKTIVDASLGGQTVVAGNGADTIIGGPHDVLTGGNGPDTFVFGPSPGPNTITDFDPHNDLIQFNHALFASYAAVLGAESFDGHSTIITNPADPNQSVTLQSVAPSNLSARNFQFT